MSTTIDQRPGPFRWLARLRHDIEQNTHARRDAAAALDRARAERAESERRLAETRAQNEQTQAELLRVVVQAAFDIGYSRGHTDALIGPDDNPPVTDYLSDLLDTMQAMHKTACESLDALQAIVAKGEE